MASAPLRRKSHPQCGGGLVGAPVSVASCCRRSGRCKRYCCCDRCADRNIAGFSLPDPLVVSTGYIESCAQMLAMLLRPFGHCLPWACSDIGEPESTHDIRIRRSDHNGDVAVARRAVRQQPVVDPREWPRAIGTAEKPHASSIDQLSAAHCQPGGGFLPVLPTSGTPPTSSMMVSQKEFLCFAMGQAQFFARGRRFSTDKRPSQPFQTRAAVRLRMRNCCRIKDRHTARKWLCNGRRECVVDISSNFS